MWKGAGPAGGPTHHRNSARGLIEAQVLDLLPAPTTIAADHPGIRTIKPGQQEHLSATVINLADPLLPTPSANVGTNGGSQHPDKRRAGNHQPSIQDVAEHTLLPTPQAHDAQKGKSPEQVAAMRARGHGVANLNETAENVLAAETNWGAYEPAIRRWEAVVGRPSPPPTELNAKGNHRLSPRFTEFMMGVPEGWICDTDISRNDKLKAAGNGVVPAQAAAALTDMLAAFEKDRP